MSIAAPYLGAPGAGHGRVGRRWRKRWAVARSTTVMVSRMEAIAVLGHINMLCHATVVRALRIQGPGYRHFLRLPSQKNGEGSLNDLH